MTVHRLALVLGLAALAATLSSASPSSASAAVTFGEDLSQPADTTDPGCAALCTYFPVAAPVAGFSLSPMDGVIVRWRIRTASTTPVRFFVGYTLGQNPPQFTPAGTNTVETFAARQPIFQNQSIGLIQDGTHALQTQSIYAVGVANSGTLGSSPPPEDRRLNDTRLLINADVEPDADRDEFGDETQDTCPSDPAIQTRACGMDLSVTPGIPFSPGITRRNLKFGQKVTHEVDVRAQGTARDVRIGATLPAGLKLLEADAGPNSPCTKSKTRVECIVGTVFGPEQPGARPPGTLPPPLVGSPARLRLVLQGVRSGVQSVGGSVATSTPDINAANNSAKGDFNVTFSRSPCKNRLLGTPRADVLTGTPGGDSLNGAGGNDRITGGARRDCLAGGAGRDVIDGGPDRDKLSGGNGNDTIRARDGDKDIVRCGAGTDSVAADRIDVLVGCERASIR